MSLFTFLFSKMYFFVMHEPSAFRQAEGLKATPTSLPFKKDQRHLSVGAHHPCGRWLAGRVPRPSPTGVGSYK
jgi:hypothetical protein